MNQISISYGIVLMVTGAILLASVNHTIIFVHNRLQLIGYYAIYLWSSFFYWIFRCIYFNPPPELYIMPDEILQMISFAFYIRFAKVAMELNPETDKYTYTFCNVAPAVIGIYVIAHSVLFYLTNIHAIAAGYLLAAYMVIRVFLLLLGFICLVMVYGKRN